MKKVSQEDQNNQNMKINELEQSNRALQEKLKLLRIQLESQTQLQSAAFSYSRSASLHRPRTNLHSSRNFHSATGFKTDDYVKPSNGKHESVLHQLRILQEEFDLVKEQHKNRISELEDQLEKHRSSVSPTKLKVELNENVELIKLKRLSKKQAAQIQSLQSQLEIANEEIKQLQSNLNVISTEKDNLRVELSNEKCEITKLDSDILTLKENNKFLEEQLNDLKTEKATLKEHNENLLKLSLKKKDSAICDSDTKFLKQIKELEENLRKETIAKSELSSKLAEAELQNVKLQNELTRNSVFMSEMQTINLSQKNEIEKLKDKLLDHDLSRNRKNSSTSTEDKSVTALITNNLETGVQNDRNSTSFLADLNDDIDSNTKIQLYKITREFNQCKELLRVQYGLNNKYKMEIEELQKIFHKNEKLTSDHLRNFQNILRKHEEKLSQIENINKNELLKFLVNDLNKILSVKKLGCYQDYINGIDKLLEGYISYVENSFLKLNSSTKDKRDIGEHAVLDHIDEFVQFDKNLEQGEILIEDRKLLDISTSSTLSQDSPTDDGSVLFELRIEKANFKHFSEHLIKSTNNNPRIFLTWNFLDDAEHQAYTPTISVNEGVFNCSCQYKGAWSEFLFQYLKQHGICIEIHLVQEDISVKLAETVIDTSLSLVNPNNYQPFTSEFQNDNIKGDVTGNYILKCDDKVSKMISSENSIHCR